MTGRTSSRRASASTPLARPTTTATAGSCPTSCATCSAPERRRATAATSYAPSHLGLGAYDVSGGVGLLHLGAQDPPETEGQRQGEPDGAGGGELGPVLTGEVAVVQAVLAEGEVHPGLRLLEPRLVGGQHH